MEKKINLSEFSEGISHRTGQERKLSDAFLTALFDMIEQGLEVDKFVKVRGLGTFKLITVSERESININTGERFQISSHGKISFTPDNSLKELINKPFAQFQTVVINEGTDLSLLESVEMPDEEGNADETQATPAPSQEDKTAEQPEHEVHAAQAAMPQSKAIPVTLPLTAEAPETDAETENSPDRTSFTAEMDADINEEPTHAPQETGLQPSPAPGNNVAPGVPPSDAVPPIPDLPLPPAQNSENVLPLPRPEEQVPTHQENAADTHRAGHASEEGKNPEQPAPAGTPPQAGDPMPHGTAPGATDCSAVQPGVQYIIRETREAPRPNIWKFVAITLAAAILMAFSYCAGYYHMLCF